MKVYLYFIAQLEKGRRLHVWRSEWLTLNQRTPTVMFRAEVKEPLLVGVRAVGPSGILPMTYLEVRGEKYTRRGYTAFIHIDILLQGPLTVGLEDGRTL